MSAKSFAFISTMEGHTWGGSEELWSRAAQHLVQGRHQVTVHATRSLQPLQQLGALAAAGCQIVKPEPRLKRLPRRLYERLRSYDRAAWLKQLKPDLCVISQGWFTEGSDWFQACHEASIPYAVVVQAAGTGWWPHAGALDSLQQGMDRARACYFVSQANRKIVQRQLGTRLENAQVLCNPFKLPYDSDPPWPVSETFNLACVGRLDFNSKGQDVLFEVLCQPKWKARPLRVTLYGEGPCRTALERLKAQHGLEQVTLAGHIGEVASIWSHNHALLLPSRIEGMPLAGIEAMLCGRPCIVTDVAGCEGELVQDGVTGFVAPALTPTLLDDAMERAWQARGQWQTMGQRAREHVRKLVPRDPARVFADKLFELVSPN